MSGITACLLLLDFVIVGIFQSMICRSFSLVYVHDATFVENGTIHESLRQALYKTLKGIILLWDVR